MSRVLLVTSVLPWPLHRNGGAQRTELVRRALTACGCQVDVAAFVPDSGGTLASPETMQAAGVVASRSIPEHHQSDYPHLPRLFRAFKSLQEVQRSWTQHYEPFPEAIEIVRNLCRNNDYAAVVVRYLGPALMCNLPDSAGGIPTLLDYDDIDWITLQANFVAEPWEGLGGRIGMKRVLRKVKALTRPAVHRFNAVWVASEEDAAFLRNVEDVPGERVVTLPNIPFNPADPSGDKALLPSPLPPSKADSRIVVFVGDLQHGPNKSGLERFINEVWPLVRARVPDARFRVVGRGLSDSQKERWSAVSGVEPVGFTEDLRAEYETAALAVVPAWWGGGTKIKVAEAAAMGRAQVVTPAAVRGYDRLAGTALVTAEAPDAFARAVVDLLNDPERRRKLAEGGPSRVVETYNFAAVREAVRRGLAAAQVPIGSRERTGMAASDEPMPHLTPQAQAIRSM